jgi:hypothetical protein
LIFFYHGIIFIQRQKADKPTISRQADNMPTKMRQWSFPIFLRGIMMHLEIRGGIIFSSIKRTNKLKKYKNGNLN